MPPRDDGNAAAAEIAARMRAYGGDVIVQVECCELLSGIMVTDGAAAVNAVVAALRRHAATAVQVQGCAALGALTASHTRNCVKAGAAGAIEAVAVALRALPANAQLQKLGCRALGNMAFDDASNRLKAGSAGALEAAVAAMVAHTGDADVQTAACNAINIISDELPHLAAKAAEAGAIKAVRAGMRAHLCDADVQRHGCITLGNFGKLAAYRRKDAVAGSLQAIVSALLAHPAHVGVQASGCNALANLLDDQHVAHDSESKRLVTHMMQAIVAALVAHRAVAEVQREGAYVICCLADAADKKVKGLGVVRALVAALRAHSGNANVQSNGGNALARVLPADADNLAEAGAAIETAVAALRAHPAHAGVQHGGCLLLCNFLDDAVNQSKAVVAGAVDAICGALCAHPTEEAVQIKGCAALLSIVHGNPEHAHRACAVGAMDAVVASITAAAAGCMAPESRSSMYAAGCGALIALMQGDAARECLAVSAGALEAVLAGGGGLLTEAAKQLVLQLEAAAQRHDTGVCAHTARCKRCAAMRACGAMCALSSCNARKRGDDTGKGLLWCSRCHAAAYCGPAHQRNDWERHKTECRKLAQSGDGGPGRGSAA